jgi:hypothetical protein
LKIAYLNICSVKDMINVCSVTDISPSLVFTVARRSQESYLAKALPNWPIKTHGFDESAAR